VKEEQITTIRMTKANDAPGPSPPLLFDPGQQTDKIHNSRTHRGFVSDEFRNELME
jgi:hypothetical protein